MDTSRACSSLDTYTCDFYSRRHATPRYATPRRTRWLIRLLVPRPPAVLADYQQLMFAIEKAREEGNGKVKRNGSAYSYNKIGKA